jgi:TonB family protein
MTANTPPTEGRTNTSAGHLSVHVEGAHPAEVLFLFEQQEKRLGPALLASLVYHFVVIAALVVAYRYGAMDSAVPIVIPERPSSQIIWLVEPGPGGGGGGGGNQMKEPPRKAELPGRDKITVPVVKPIAPQVPEEPKEPKEEPPPVIAQLNIPAQSLAAATESLPGAVEPPPGPPSLSQGSGRGGGAGTGTGSGSGPGTGSGLGPGSGGGTGGGVYRPGSGVTLPIKLREVKPAYTSDAMRAKVQGTVLLQCVVRPDGTVGDVEVVKSLDPVFGLDQEAVKAARQWLFRPGTRFGEAVPVLITIELTFTLR